MGADDAGDVVEAVDVVDMVGLIGTRPVDARDDLGELDPCSGPSCRYASHSPLSPAATKTVGADRRLLLLLLNNGDGTKAAVLNDTGGWESSDCGIRRGVEIPQAPRSYPYTVVGRKQSMALAHYGVYSRCGVARLSSAKHNVCAQMNAVKASSIRNLRPCGDK